MRLKRVDKDARIVESYKRGWSFRRLQKHYRRSPNNIAQLVKGIEVVCSSCGKHKGKVRFHSHHPDRVNFPHSTILLCPSCHAKEEAELRREKENQSQSPLNPIVPTTQTLGSAPRTTSIPVRLGPLSPTGEKIVKGSGIALIVEALWPGFFERRWREIQDHWQRS